MVSIWSRNVRSELSARYRTSSHLFKPSARRLQPSARLAVRSGYSPARLASSRRCLEAANPPPKDMPRSNAAPRRPQGNTPRPCAHTSAISRATRATLCLLKKPRSAENWADIHLVRAMRTLIRGGRYRQRHRVVHFRAEDSHSRRRFPLSICAIPCRDASIGP